MHHKSSVEHDDAVAGEAAVSSVAKRLQRVYLRTRK